MKYKFILLIMSVVMVILLVLTIKNIMLNKKYNHNKKQNNHDIYNDVLADNKIMMDRILKLELEVSKLKEKNSKKKQWHNKNDFMEYSNNINDNNFKKILNYNFFKGKNVDIIDMYNSGRSKEEIAKALNKSIREIEMVINLVKQ